MRTVVVWESVLAAISAGAEMADVLDVGGGTGGFAVPLAALGHRVTVVDPSPDALAALQRRAREADVEVRAVQGDAAGLLDVVPAASADLVLCHGVLEHVDEVAPAVAALVQVLRPGGRLSLLVPNRNAFVLAHAVAGRFVEARDVLRTAEGFWGGGHVAPRRFSEAGLRDGISAAGLQIVEVHGAPVLADLVPAVVVDADPMAADDLLALEQLAATRPELRAYATALHVLARR